MPENDLANDFQKECVKGDLLKHPELVTLYYVVEESSAMQNPLISVEAAGGEIII